MAKKRRSKEKNKIKSEGSLFDKAMREISDETIIEMVLERLNYSLNHIEAVKTKMQTTYQRETDSCYFINANDSVEAILHFEYQSGNDPYMVLRVFEYVAMLTRRFPGKRIHSTVIYVGTEEPTMRTELTKEEIFTGFELIDARTLNTQKLLNSKKTKTIVHAILADYPEEQGEEMIYKIIKRLRKESKCEKEFIQRCYQLQVFSFLRNLGKITNEILSNMSVHIDIANTQLFKTTFRPQVLEYERMLVEERAAKEAALATSEKAKAISEEALLEKEMAEAKLLATIGNLLATKTFSDEEIANITNTDLSYITGIKKEMDL